MYVYEYGLLYVYIYIYIHTICIHTHTHTHTHIQIHTHIHIHIYIYIYIYLYMYILIIAHLIAHCALPPIDRAFFRSCDWSFWRRAKDVWSHGSESPAAQLTLACHFDWDFLDPKLKFNWLMDHFLRYPMIRGKKRLGLKGNHAFLVLLQLRNWYGIVIICPIGWSFFFFSQSRFQKGPERIYDLERGPTVNPQEHF